ncbi:hypothetical protein C8F04DRAFT_1256022 [Mycena alexandri]|uniref:Uncharacterized protein n=1 Tax=Mycena alexandri TaxID=1745969 RepID=A0AAD6T6W0_9AGAR|nr:hypothetical protein C8F04DRAFT_1256022 [Mycena alexandri]
MGAIPVRTGAPYTGGMRLTKTERIPSLQPLSFDLGLDVAFDSPQATPTAATYAASGSGPSPFLPVLAGHPAHNQHYLCAPHAQYVRACGDVLPLPGLDGAFDSPQVTPTAATYAASGSGPSPSHSPRWASPRPHQHHLAPRAQLVRPSSRPPRRTSAPPTKSSTHDDDPSHARGDALGTHAPAHRPARTRPARATIHSYPIELRILILPLANP